MMNEVQEFAKMSDDELRAYQRILAAPTLKVDPDGKMERHAKLVADELARRAAQKKD